MGWGDAQLGGIAKVMQLNEIRGLAEKFVKENNSLCVRMEIAGSIRREKAQPRDVEVVCIPMYDIRRDLFGQEISRKNFLFDCLQTGSITKGFDIVKGSGDCPKYVQLQVRNGPKLDIFFATPENWGWIFFLRTGPKAWNIRAVQELKRQGYTPKDGYIYWKQTEHTTNTYTEGEVFQILAWDWVEPRNRT